MKNRNTWKCVSLIGDTRGHKKSKHDTYSNTMKELIPCFSGINFKRKSLTFHFRCFVLCLIYPSIHFLLTNSGSKFRAFNQLNVYVFWLDLRKTENNREWKRWALWMQDKLPKESIPQNNKSPVHQQGLNVSNTLFALNGTLPDKTILVNGNSTVQNKELYEVWKSKVKWIPQDREGDIEAKLKLLA